jgi:hypothetical protein
MKLFNSFFGLLVLILIFKFAVPNEVADLATQIVVKVLTLIRDLLAQITLPTI